MSVKIKLHVLILCIKVEDKIDEALVSLNIGIRMTDSYMSSLHTTDRQS